MSPKLSRAAKRFKMIVVACSAILVVTVFLPWCTIVGYTFTFMGADGWRWIPITEVVVAAGAIIGAWRLPGFIRPIGQWTGSSALILNVVGAVVADKYANIDTDPILRVRAAISIGPAWGGWLALMACLALIVIGFSHWSPTEPIEHVSAQAIEAQIRNQLPPMSADVESHLPPLPHLNEILAPRPPSESSSE